MANTDKEIIEVEEIKDHTPVLPKASTAALKKMVEVTESLADLVEAETNAMATNDSMAFITAEEEKFHVSNKYDRAVKEFQERREEFRGENDQLLEKLVQAQTRLGEAAAANIKMLKKYRKDVVEQDANDVELNITDVEEAEEE